MTITIFYVQCYLLFYMLFILMLVKLFVNLQRNGTLMMVIVCMIVRVCDNVASHHHVLIATNK